VTEERKQLMLEVMDGHPKLPEHLVHINRFERCDEILRWLIKNEITGARFVEWVRFEHRGSVLQACNTILAGLHPGGASRSSGFGLLQFP
jgi:hypothetical protein